MQCAGVYGAATALGREGGGLVAAEEGGEPLVIEGTGWTGSYVCTYVDSNLSSYVTSVSCCVVRENDEQQNAPVVSCNPHPPHPHPRRPLVSVSKGARCPCSTDPRREKRAE